MGMDSALQERSKTNSQKCLKKIIKRTEVREKKQMQKLTIKSRGGVTYF